MYIKFKRLKLDIDEIILNEGFNKNKINKKLEKIENIKLILLKNKIAYFTILTSTQKKTFEQNILPIILLRNKSIEYNKKYNRRRF